MLIKEYTKDNIKFVEISNNLGFKVELVDIGASIYGVYVDNVPMTLTTTNISDFIRPSHYHGKTIGRLSGRIKDGKYKINNKEYQIENNDNGNALHGGVNGISNQIFNYEINQKDNYVEVIYTYLSKDGESGFNGNMSFKVTYIIYEDKMILDLKLNAICDEDTICMLTNHVYFSLGDYDNSNLFVKVNASKYVTLSSDLIPTSEETVTDLLDFRAGKLLVKDIEHPDIKNSCMNGYDLEYIFDTLSIDNPQVVVSNDKYLLNIYCDTAGTIIYSDNFENTAKFLTNENDLTRRGMAIEPSDHHLDNHFLKANTSYDREIIYEFIRK